MASVIPNLLGRTLAFVALGRWFLYEPSGLSHPRGSK